MEQPRTEVGEVGVSEKKPLEQLIAEHKEYRKLIGKNFTHVKSGQSYQLLMTVHDTETQELMAVYCLNAMSQMKFTRRMGEFLEKFEEGHQ